MKNEASYQEFYVVKLKMRAKKKKKKRKEDENNATSFCLSYLALWNAKLAIDKGLNPTSLFRKKLWNPLSWDPKHAEDKKNEPFLFYFIVNHHKYDQIQ